MWPFRKMRLTPLTALEGLARCLSASGITPSARFSDQRVLRYLRSSALTRVFLTLDGDDAEFAALILGYAYNPAIKTRLYLGISGTSSGRKYLVAGTAPNPQYDQERSRYEHAERDHAARLAAHPAAVAAAKNLPAYAEYERRYSEWLAAPEQYYGCGSCSNGQISDGCSAQGYMTCGVCGGTGQGAGWLKDPPPEEPVPPEPKLSLPPAPCRELSVYVAIDPQPRYSFDRASEGFAWLQLEGATPSA